MPCGPFICLCLHGSLRYVGHVGEPCRKSSTDWDDIWAADSLGPKEPWRHLAIMTNECMLSSDAGCATITVAVWYIYDAGDVPYHALLLISAVAQMSNNVSWLVDQQSKH